MTTVGLDLHKRYITGCALTEDGCVLAERRRLRPELGELTGWLAALPGADHGGAWKKLGAAGSQRIDEAGRHAGRHRDHAPDRIGYRFAHCEPRSRTTLHSVSHSQE